MIMNLTNLYQTIGNIALSKTNVNSYHKEDPYGALNTKEVEYGAVCFAVESVSDDDNVRTYDAVMYYADRLVEGGTNWVSVQDDGVNVLTAIVNELRNDDDVIDVSFEITYTPFKQKFADYLAGAYCSIKIETPIDNCIDLD